MNIIHNIFLVSLLHIFEHKKSKKILIHFCIKNLLSCMIINYMKNIKKSHKQSKKNRKSTTHNRSKSTTLKLSKSTTHRRSRRNRRSRR